MDFIITACLSITCCSTKPAIHSPTERFLSVLAREERWVRAGRQSREGEGLGWLPWSPAAPEF